MPADLHLGCGQKLIAQVEKIALGGDGIARLDGLVIFVPYTCPGESVEVQLIEKKQNFARARLLRIIKKTPQREEPPCPYYFNPSPSPSSHPHPHPLPSREREREGNHPSTATHPSGRQEGNSFPSRGEEISKNNLWCGGCNFQHLAYSAQLKQKELAFKETLKKIGNIDPEKVLPLLPAPEENLWRFRNKIQIPFIKSKEDKILAGFFAPNSHEIVPIEDCLIHSQEMLEVIKFVKRCLENWKLEPYSEKTHQGWLRHLLIREAIPNANPSIMGDQFTMGKLLVTFVTANSSFPYKEKWTAEFKENFSNVVGLWQNINPHRTNVILGKSWKKIWGENALVEKLEGLQLQLKVSAGSFFQVNTKMAEKLYGIVKKILQEEDKKRETLLDLYCGVGGLGLVCSSFYEKVIGVDENPSSIADARANARLNGCHNLRFVCSDVQEFMESAPRGASQLGISAVVLDPPRKGVPGSVLTKIAEVMPEKIVYVSCDPSTLARDLKILLSQNYRIKKIQPLDFFPQSSHIESVTLLEIE